MTPEFRQSLETLVVDASIKLVAALPDDWTKPMIDWFRQRAGVTNVDVAREAEAVAIVSGAFFTATHALAVMGASGLFTCLGELATLNLRHQIPVFILVSDRGAPNDHRIYQEIQGRSLKPALTALDIPWMRIGSYDEALELPAAYQWCRLQKRPVVAFVSRALLKEGG